MKKTTWVALVMALGSCASLLAHHSLANYDTTTPVRVTGTVVRFLRINPHSIVYLDQATGDGNRRWAVEGPSNLQLARSGFAEDGLKPGDVVEVCGYLPKEPIVWQVPASDSAAVSTSGRLINGELMVMPDGHERSWGDYGVHKCFAPGHRDQHSQ